MEGIFEYQAINAVSWWNGLGDPMIQCYRRNGYGAGVSTCLLGNSEMPNAWTGGSVGSGSCIIWEGSTLPNCVGYSWGRACYTYTLGLMTAGIFEESGNMYMRDGEPDNYFWTRGYGDLLNRQPGPIMYEDAKNNPDIPTSETEPQLGCTVIWANESYQHIAFVEDVLDDGRCLISESGWGTSYWPLTLQETRYCQDGYSTRHGLLEFVGFIYAPPECSFISKYWLESKDTTKAYALPNRIWVV